MAVAGNHIRVQSLVQDGEMVVPPQYIQPPDTRPNQNHEKRTAEQLPTAAPVIDLSDVSSFHEELGKACREWGAFEVINHGVPLELLDGMMRLGRSFFEDCTVDQKFSYACDPNSPASEGYGSRMLVSSNDTVLDWRDYFDHHTLPLSRRNPSKWPHFSSDYRKTVSDYSEQIHFLAQKLLGLIAESLGLPSSSMKDGIGEFYQNITVSYYPPCPQPELTLGLQSHSDIGAITLIIQDDVGGLEVLKNGEWIPINPLPHAIVVILADQTEIITNGEYKSAVHRAITNSKKARLSVSSFHDPAKAKIIRPAFEPPKYHQVVYGDYYSSWYTKGPEGKRNIDTLKL